MDLKTYLSARDTAAREALAAECGTTLGHLTNVSYLYKPCSPILAARIERATNGAVTRQELRPEDWRDIWPELTAAA